MGTIFSVNVLWFLLATFGSLVAGTIARLATLHRADEQTRVKRLSSLRTWWVLAVVILSGVLAGRVGIFALLAAASLLAMREYVSIAIPKHLNVTHDRWSTGFVYAAIVVYYIAMYFAGPMATRFAAAGFIALAWIVATIHVLQGETANYTQRTAALVWGAMIVVFGLSHAALITNLAPGANPVAGPVGWFLYLLVLTEVNDISQALVGRRLGGHLRHRIARRVSPNKTWEGFIGGVVVTLLLSMMVAPWLTPLAQWPLKIGPLVLEGAFYTWPLVLGLLIAVAGLIGDLNMSAVKRDVGVKDSSELLPGMGGIIDRVDSLTFTAPVVYYVVAWMV